MVDLCQKHKPQHPHLVKVSLQGPVMWPASPIWRLCHCVACVWEGTKIKEVGGGSYGHLDSQDWQAFRIGAVATFLGRLSQPLMVFGKKENFPQLVPQFGKWQGSGQAHWGLLTVASCGGLPQMQNGMLSYLLWFGNSSHHTSPGLEQFSSIPSQLHLCGEKTDNLSINYHTFFLVPEKETKAY